MLARNTNASQKPAEPGMLIAFPENAKNVPGQLSALEAIPVPDLQKDSPMVIARYGLQKLRAEGQLTAQEFQSLWQICDSLFAAQQAQVETAIAFTTVRQIYDELLVKKETGPMALAIASVASGALASDLGSAAAPSLPAAELKSNIDIGLVGGLVVGGLIGVSLSGATGAMIGCAVGGIAGAVAGTYIKS